MTHQDFIEAVLETGIFTEATEIKRISMESALIPASWMARIMEEMPEAGEYLAKRSPEEWKIYKAAMKNRQAAATLGKIGGKAKSAAKAAAARENGKKGGRPRKTTKGKN